MRLRAINPSDYDAVAALIESDRYERLREVLRGIADVERVLARVALRSARPRDLAALREAHPSAEIDWLADRKYAGVLDLVDGITERIRTGYFDSLGVTALSLMLVLEVTAAAPSFTREGLALSLAVILLGFLMMITRRNAVTQIVGFMSIENGLILAATGASGMPLVVEFSVAFSVLIALFVFAVFVFRIRERFDSVDIEALDQARGDTR